MIHFAKNVGYYNSPAAMLMPGVIDCSILQTNNMHVHVACTCSFDASSGALSFNALLVVTNKS